MINEAIENIIYPIIESKVKSHKTSVIAIGNTRDHINLLLSISSEKNIVILVKKVKGTNLSNYLVGIYRLDFSQPCVLTHGIPMYVLYYILGS